ncbi:MAG: SIR2 family protein [Pyrinomonadaceae bacterium]
MDVPLDEHYGLVMQAITDGTVIPLLGAGVNLCGRPMPTPWQHGRFLPSGDELATYLAEKFSYPQKERRDLARVSQFAALKMGPAVLYEKLRKVFDADYPPTPLHQLIASLPSTLDKKGYGPQYQLIITTNYDDLLERAFRAMNEPFDVVSYIADGEDKGSFLHWPQGDEPRLIEKANEYELPLDHTVILKIHGDIDRTDADRDSYVITEDHYIDFLTRSDIDVLLPPTLRVKLRHSHFLFLGYGLRDWNLRVILHRLWDKRKLSRKSWAIQLHPDYLDREFWRNREVEIYDVRLEEYVTELNQRLATLPPKPAEV